VFNRTKVLKAVVEPYDKITEQLEDVEMMSELAEAEDDAVERGLAEAEIESTLTAATKVMNDLEMKSLLGGELDANNVYLNINSGAGGTESNDWAEMLCRMYRRFCEQEGWEFSILEAQPGDETGLKSLSALISGDFAFGFLKGERGVHRLVRISPFDSQGRRHTSFVALDIMAEVDDTIEIEIEEKDLRMDTYRASGAGGQHVNKTDSAVRLTHMPTGIVAACQAERSQHRNRDKAMNMLRARIYEFELDKQRKATEKFYGDKGSIAWGSQIRSYVM
jgi:peptide chain release factor 2